MTTHTRSSGIRISLPDTVRAFPESPSAVPASGRRGIRNLRDPVPMPSSGVTATPADSIAADMIKALQNQDMELVDTVPLEARPVPVARETGRMRRAPATQALIEMDLAPNEDAVVLIERDDGSFEWCWPKKVIAEVPQRAREKRGGVKAAAVAIPTASGMRTVRFEVPFNAVRKPSAKRAGARRGLTDWIAQKVADAAKAYVLKFVVRKGTKVLMDFLERNVERGLMIMDVDDPAKWRRAETVGELSLPTDRAPRILLFIHGTFSSTVGSYGALGLSPWGQDFLRAARGTYDAIIGFDHPTLSVDPQINAEDLLSRLKLETFSQPPKIDVVCYSRGGLVYRVLTERLFLRIPKPPKIGRVIFVACTLSGTVLARPENWSTFVDFYTNLSAAAARVIGKLPNVTAKTVTGLVNGAVQGVADLVKCLATVAVTENQVPGLAAMNPDGPFVAKLNENQPNQPTPATTWYAAILSNFEPACVFEDGFTGIPKGFAVQTLGAAVDQLLAVPNDLVVHTASMTAVDPQLGAFMKDQLDYGTNPNVYHTNYFIQPETAGALARWFGLVPELHDLPARVDTDVMSIPNTMPTGTVVDLVKRRKPSFVVLEKEWNDQRLHYAFPAEEILQKGTDFSKDISISEVFPEVHEDDSSRRTTRGQVMAGRDDVPDPSQPPARGSSTSLRKVVLDGSEVVGVIAGFGTGPSVDLGLLARDIRRTRWVKGTRITISAIDHPAAEILANRAMPTLPPRQGIPLAPISTRGLTQPKAAPKKAAKKKTAPKKAAKKKAAKKKAAAPPSGTGGATRTEAPVDSDRITCHFLAEMEDRVEVQKPASVTVTVSRESIQAALDISAEGTATIQANRKITIELLPKKNADASGNTRLDIDAPGLGEDVECVFGFLPTNEGEGEVQVRVRQGAVPILTLRLIFDIVARREGVVRRRSAEATATSVPEWKTAPVQLRITEMPTSGGLCYHFELSSIEFKFSTIGKSNVFQGDRLTYVAALYNRIEKRAVNTKGDIQAFDREMRAEGGLLLEELIPKPIQKKLWELRKQLTCIQVLSEEPFIPWEVVCLKDPDATSSVVNKGSPHLAELGLVRWLTFDDNNPNSWPTTDLVVRKGRAHHVIPDYPNPPISKLPAAAEEEAFLVKAFGSTPIAAENNAVATMLEGPGLLDLFHFAGHGDANSANIGDAGILLKGRVQAGTYFPDVLNASVVGQTATLPDGENRPIVVLNACRAGRLGIQLTRVGGFAKAFISQGAGLFIGAQWSVGDAPARTFTEAFYTALLADKTVAEATRDARAAARSAGEMTWLAYAVYGHPEAKMRRK